MNALFNVAAIAVGIMIVLVGMRLNRREKTVYLVLVSVDSSAALIQKMRSSLSEMGVDARVEALNSVLGYPVQYEFKVKA